MKLELRPADSWGRRPGPGSRSVHPGVLFLVLALVVALAAIAQEEPDPGFWRVPGPGGVVYRVSGGPIASTAGHWIYSAQALGARSPLTVEFVLVREDSSEVRPVATFLEVTARTDSATVLLFYSKAEVSTGDPVVLRVQPRAQRSSPRAREGTRL